MVVYFETTCWTTMVTYFEEILYTFVSMIIRFRITILYSFVLMIVWSQLTIFLQ